MIRRNVILLFSIYYEIDRKTLNILKDLILSQENSKPTAFYYYYISLRIKYCAIQVL
jgi:hypothetical protein